MEGRGVAATMQVMEADGARARPQLHGGTTRVCVSVVYARESAIGTPPQQRVARRSGGDRDPPTPPSYLTAARPLLHHA